MTDQEQAIIDGVHFGSVGKPLPDYQHDNDPDPDDEEMATPDYVKVILGFDPREESDGE